MMAMLVNIWDLSVSTTVMLGCNLVMSDCNLAMLDCN
jgi:hypothetical protein